MKKLLLILSALSPLVQAECFNAETRIIFDGKPELQKEVLCELQSDRLLFYVSKGCEASQCSVLQRPLAPLLIKDYRGNIGSPGFKLCRALTGIPQIFEWRKGTSEKWQNTERCFFEKDFVEIGLLTKKWKPFINKK